MVNLTSSFCLLFSFPNQNLSNTDNTTNTINITNEITRKITTECILPLISILLCENLTTKIEILKDLSLKLNLESEIDNILASMQVSSINFQSNE